MSKSGIHRSIKTSKAAADKYQKDLDEARILMEAVKGKPNTDVVEVAASLLSQNLLKTVRNVDGLEFETAGDLVDAVQKMAKAQVNLSKFRLDFEKGFEAAKAEVLKGLAADLKDKPEVLAQIRQTVAAVQPKSAG